MDLARGACETEPKIKISTQLQRAVLERPVEVRRKILADRPRQNTDTDTVSSEGRLSTLVTP